MLTIVDTTFLIDILTFVLINLWREVGDAGIYLPYLSVFTDVVGVDGIPHPRGIGLHLMGTDNLEEGGLQLRAFLTVSSLIICPCGLCQGSETRKGKGK